MWSPLQIMAPMVRGRKGTHEKVLESARRSGYVRVRIDGSIYDLGEGFLPEKNKKHNVEIVVDRIVIKPEIQSRLYDSLETATNLTSGVVLVEIIGQGEQLYSLNYACPEHNISMPKPEPNLFSFNNPAGACPTCTGLGTFMKVDPDLVVPDPSLSIRETLSRPAAGTSVSAWPRCIMRVWPSTTVFRWTPLLRNCRNRCGR